MKSRSPQKKQRTPGKPFVHKQEAPRGGPKRRTDPSFRKKTPTGKPVPSGQRKSETVRPRKVAPLRAFPKRELPDKYDPPAYIPRQNKHSAINAPLNLGDETDLQLFLPKLTRPAFFLVLDQVQDPHNFGACLRTAEGAGVDAVIFTRDHSAPITLTVRTVACGAAERLRLFQITNLARVLDLLKEKGIWVIGTSDKADKDIYSADFSLPTALVLGSEGEGLRRLTAERCDSVVKIPLAGKSESLNVSVSCGVCLYEVVRQRKTGA